MSTMKICLQHETEGHDLGEWIDFTVIDNYCQGMQDGDKEFLLTDKGLFERYSCYYVHSPYGWKKSDKTWEEVHG